MFNLFGKKEISPEERLAECQRKQNWAGLAKAYYELGVDAMNQGELNKANLWLNRADTIYSAQDAVYKKLGEGLIDDCSDRIGQLEEESLLYNEIPAQIEERAERLRDIKIRVWGLLSLARLVNLGDQLASLPGCAAFGKLGWAVDTVLKSFQEAPTEDEFNGLRDLSSALYELGDTPAFWGMGNEISVPGGKPFQVFDFNGMMGIHLEIEAYLSNHLQMLCTVEPGAEPPAPETGIIAGALLPDYYVRNGADDLMAVPQIKAELERIWKDCEFLSSELSWEMVKEKVEEYKNLCVLV